MSATAEIGAPSANWRRWVNERPVAAAILVGIIATQLGTYFGYVFPAVGLPTLPWPLYNGALALGAPDLWGTPGFYFVGLSLHFVNGVVFAVLYAFLARLMLPFADNHMGNVMKGLLYGLIMTVVSVGLLVPYAYVPKQGYGFFLFSGPDGWKLPFAVLIWHLIYGFFLGTLYQPKDQMAFDPNE